jgi:hypothetical protein
LTIDNVCPHPSLFGVIFLVNLSEIIRVAYYKIGMIENFIVVLTMLPFHFFEQSKTIFLLFDISPDFFFALQMLRFI